VGYKGVQRVNNWKTSLCGTVGAIGVSAVTYVQHNPQQFAKYPWAFPVACILAASGILGNGIASKDATTQETKKNIKN
jgi:hypothetical protein